MRYIARLMQNELFALLQLLEWTEGHQCCLAAQDLARQDPASVLCVCTGMERSRQVKLRPSRCASLFPNCPMCCQTPVNVSESGYSVGVRALCECSESDPKLILSCVRTSNAGWSYRYEFKLSNLTTCWPRVPLIELPWSGAEDNNARLLILRGDRTREGTNQ